MYYYSIFQQLFKFVPRYRFEKSVEKHFGTVTANILPPFVR